MLPLRQPLVVAGVLVALSGVAWLGQQQHGDVGGTTDPLTAPPALVAAPVVAPAAQPSASTRSTGSTALPTADPAWVQATAAAAGIAAPAVTAYADAVLREPSGCDLGWTTLAGLGWVESQQGTYGGRTLLPDGRPSTPIVGPALDGAGVAAIPADADGTALHGDSRWDHAVGPLQFLPSTWRRWGRDGDGDGTADPQDLDDAAAAAAAYLCGTGQDLATGAGWSAAVFAYNHSDDYVRAVYDAATTYADRTTS